ncbi:hypothetical protein GCM10010421_47990 [Streptomyces glaucus]|uniref:Secreted protein n=1 Tax=Streptomyces glaucus TaxID=284029 RepID=A0ABN3K6P8_9ACTN
MAEAETDPPDRDGPTARPEFAPQAADRVSMVRPRSDQASSRTCAIGCRRGARLLAEDLLPGRPLPQAGRMTRLALVVADRALVGAARRPALPVCSAAVMVTRPSQRGTPPFGRRRSDAGRPVTRPVRPPPP